MPTSLKAVAAFAIVFAAAAPVVILLAWRGAVPLEVGGQPVGRDEWFRLAAPLFAWSGAVMGLFAYGVITRRRWSRPVALALWAGIMAAGTAAGLLHAVPPALAWRAVIQGTVLGALSWWYFFQKTNIVAFFGARHRANGVSAPARPPESP